MEYCSFSLPHELLLTLGGLPDLPVPTALPHALVRAAPLELVRLLN